MTHNDLLDPTATAQSNVAAFPADSLSAIKSRQFVRTHLSKAGVPENVVDAAELVTSELATNAVLHAATGPTVTVSVANQLVRLEVRDASTSAPIMSDFGPDAATGRGLSVVSRTATSWGVDTDQFGKTVWAEFDVNASASENYVDNQQPHVTSELIVESTTDGMTKVVQLIDVPIDLYYALEQHNDATLREFELLAIQMQDETPEIMLVHHRLAELVVRSTRYFNTPKGRMRLAVQRARHKGLDTVNHKGTMDTDAVECAREFSDLMAEADVLCDQGVLLTSPASQPVRQLRVWMNDEIQQQFFNDRPPVSFAS